LFTALCLGSFALAAGGCGLGQDPFQFVNSIKQVTKTWTIDAELFGKMMKTESDPARLQAAQKSLVGKIDSHLAEAGKIRVPSGREAQELWAAFQTYLKDQRKIVSDDFQDLVTLKSAGDFDVSRYQAIVASCKALEDADLARLHEAEAAFEVAHNLPSR
jgi:hypothetical protein